MKSTVWAVFQYGVEGWTLKKSDRNRIESFEMWCWRKMLGISWKEHRTNTSILEEIGLERELMGKVARMQLQYLGHFTRWSAGNLALLEGSIDGLRHQGRPKRQWMDDIEEWSGCSYIQLKEKSQDREQWRRKTIEWSSAVANRHRRWSTSEWVIISACMLYYCNTVRWAWLDWGLSGWLTTYIRCCHLNVSSATVYVSEAAGANYSTQRQNFHN